MSLNFCDVHDPGEWYEGILSAVNAHAAVILNGIVTQFRLWLPDSDIPSSALRTLGLLDMDFDLNGEEEST